MKKKTLGQVTDFELKLLRVFKTVAECGSFSSAEILLGISSSAISLHMGDLEKRLGVRLCQRGRAGFSLTDEGREILRISENMMASIEHFRQQVNQLHKQLRGEFNIGIINNLVTQPQMRLTNALEKMHEVGPDIRINLCMSTPMEIERGLMDGWLHVGALPFSSTISGLHYSPLYDEKSFLYCSNRHPLFSLSTLPTKKQLSELNAIVPTSRMTSEMVAMHQLLNCVATASDREGIAFLILTGKLVGYLPDHYAANWVNNGVMKAISPEKLFFHNPIVIATRKGAHINNITDYFLSVL
ncbi:LysR family transcriptional regulator [Providencia burhodogranariea]|uniref:LysR family transcriptional regulator n=1 Tax=Providencia burhodogranariea DSM 19968 TaxID=1141662 RepID=K8WEA8_9GAMM|nr:LysR family transcriptional regulator [Providencia burhodogranariea]EKT58266.1 LysR family transcriptional regulator [Providencia burhodogranariea DSM 19968]